MTDKLFTGTLRINQPTNFLPTHTNEHICVVYESKKNDFRVKLTRKKISFFVKIIVFKPEFYGDLVYKFKKIRGMTAFSDQFREIIMRYKRIGYNLNVMRQSACLVINPITVDGYAALFNCTPADRASDSLMAPT